MFVEEVMQTKQTIKVRYEMTNHKQHHIDHNDVERNAFRIYIVEHVANLMQEMKRMRGRIICFQNVCPAHHSKE